jgi:hypothetical protein
MPNRPGPSNGERQAGIEPTRSARPRQLASRASGDGLRRHTDDALLVAPGRRAVSGPFIRLEHLAILAPGRH